MMPVHQALTEHFHILHTEKGVHFLTEPDPGFEQVYLEARKLEGWLVSDEALRALPETSANDPHAAVWRLRKQTLNRLLLYLQQTAARHMLEIGCGNGWFSHALAARLSGTSVFGLDINLQELQQAARVFGETNPLWLHGDLFRARLPERFFDMIVFNGSLQYFSDFAALFGHLLPSLAEHGEIHILDSPFYPSHRADAASKRTVAYYTQLGVQEMAAYYHAHTVGSLIPFNPEFLHNPDSFTNRLKRLVGLAVNPMPWIRLRP